MYDWNSSSHAAAAFGASLCKEHSECLSRRHEEEEKMQRW